MRKLSQCFECGAKEIIEYGFPKIHHYNSCRLQSHADWTKYPAPKSLVPKGDYIITKRTAKQTLLDFPEGVRLKHKKLSEHFSNCEKEP